MSGTQNYNNRRKKERAKTERMKNLIAMERLRLIKNWHFVENQNIDDNEIKIERHFTNPEWRTYVRYLSYGKFYCSTTICREDPEWYRIVRKPNSWIDTDDDKQNIPFRWEHTWESYCLRKYKHKMFRDMYRKKE